MRRSYRADEVPRHHRQGARRDARRGDHHRHHRRLPGRDRGRLRRARSTWSARRGSPARSRSSTPSGPARRPPSMRRPGAEGRRPGALRPAGRRAGGDHLGGEQDAGRAPRRGAGRGRRGPQGRGDRTHVRSRPRRAAGALRDAATPRCAPATSSRPWSRTRRRTTSTPTARCCATAAPGPATRGRPAQAAPKPAGVLLGLPTRSAHRRLIGPADGCGTDGAQPAPSARVRNRRLDSRACSASRIAPRRRRRPAPGPAAARPRRPARASGPAAGCRPARCAARRRPSRS